MKSLPISDSSLSLTSSSREHQEHKLHGPSSLSLESSEWPEDADKDLALLTHPSPGSLAQDKAAKVTLSPSDPLFRAQSLIHEKMSPRPRTGEKMLGRVGRKEK